MMTRPKKVETMDHENGLPHPRRPQSPLPPRSPQGRLVLAFLHKTIFFIFKLRLDLSKNFSHVPLKCFVTCDNW